jgi:hypothetical protein
VAQQKQQKTKTTKHTIEFSNNTPAPDAQSAPRLRGRVLIERTVRDPVKP